MAVLTGKLTKNLVRTLGPGRDGDGSGLYLVVDPSVARRWCQRNREGKPLRTDFGLGCADVVTLNEARDHGLKYRRLAKRGTNPRYNGQQEIPCFEEIARHENPTRPPPRVMQVCLAEIKSCHTGPDPGRDRKGVFASGDGLHDTETPRRIASNPRFKVGFVFWARQGVAGQAGQGALHQPLLVNVELTNW